MSHASGPAGKWISDAHPPCKSGLLLLCERFTQRFGQLTADGQPSSLLLNEVAAALDVPRRRLYDILNVLEAVEVRRPPTLRHDTRRYLYSCFVLLRCFILGAGR